MELGTCLLRAAKRAQFLVIVLLACFSRGALGAPFTVIDWTPPGESVPFAAADNDQAVGMTDSSHALLFNQSNQSWVNLQPAGYTSSSVRDVRGGQQVGSAFKDGINTGVHAVLWTGSAATAYTLPS